MATDDGTFSLKDARAVAKRLFLDYSLDLGDLRALIQSDELAAANSEAEVVALLERRRDELAREEAEAEAELSGDVEVAETVILPWASEQVNEVYARQRAGILDHCNGYDDDGDEGDDHAGLGDEIRGMLVAIDDAMMDADAAVSRFATLWHALRRATLSGPVQLLVLYLDGRHGDLTLYGYESYAADRRRAGREVFRELHRVSLDGFADATLVDSNELTDAGVDEEVTGDLVAMLLYKAEQYVRVAVEQTLTSAALDGVEVTYPLYVTLDVAQDEMPPGSGARMATLPAPAG